MADYMNALIQKIKQQAAETQQVLKWVLTDDSSGQHIQVVSEHEYRLIDTVCCGDDLYQVMFGTVIIDPQDIQNPDFIETYMKPFGFSSYENVANQYGNHAYQIIAECVFETDVFMRGEVRFKGDFQSCLEFITNFINKER